MEHLREHLAMRLEPIGETRLRGVLPLSPRCRNADGSLSLGAVAVMADVAAVRGTHDNRFSGGVVTSMLSLKLFAEPRGDYIAAEAEPVRIGRGGVTARGNLYDAERRLVGVLSATSAALAGEGGGAHRRDPGRRDDMFDHRPTPTTGPSVTEYLGLERADLDGPRRCYTMPFHEPLRNVNGVLHGGGACLIIEHAARSAAADSALQVDALDELDVHFLAPGLTGPFTAVVDTVPDVGARRAFVVEVLDEGRDRRKIAFGTAVAAVSRLP